MGISGTGRVGKAPPPMGGKNGAAGSGSAGGKSFPTKSFWLHSSGLNVKNPAEKMCVPSVFDL